MDAVTKWTRRANEIGVRLRTARTCSGLSQRELGEKCSSSQAVVQKIENGESLRPRIVIELALACGVTPVWLAFGEVLTKGDQLVADHL